MQAESDPVVESCKSLSGYLYTHKNCNNAYSVGIAKEENGEYYLQVTARHIPSVWQGLKVVIREGHRPEPL